MKATLRRRLRNCRRRIRWRLRPRQWPEQRRRLFRDHNVHYEVGDKARGLHAGGLGAFQPLARQLGLADAIDRELHLLKRHLPYFESDHVLNLAYNVLVGGTCLQDLERLRTDETYLDALGAPRIPDPTTAGDFLRRFSASDIDALQDVINEKRVQVWQLQPAVSQESHEGRVALGAFRLGLVGRVARFGQVHLRRQADVRSARRTETPKQLPANRPSVPATCRKTEPVDPSPQPRPLEQVPGLRLEVLNWQRVAGLLVALAGY